MENKAPQTPIKPIILVLHTRQEINIGRLKILTEELQFQECKVYIFPGEMEFQDILRSCRDVIRHHDVIHIITFKTTDERTYESWYYGKTSIKKNDILVKCAIRKVTKSIEIKASGNDPDEITGLLTQIGHDLTKEFKWKVKPVFNLQIKDYVIQRSDLLSFCDHDGNCSGEIVLENILVKRPNAVLKICGKRKPSEKEDGNIRRKEDLQTKIGLKRTKKDDKEFLERNEKKQSHKNVSKEEIKGGEREKQVLSHQEIEPKNQNTKEHAIRQRQKEQQIKEPGDLIEIIRKRSGQRREIKTTIIDNIRELSNSGYQEEVGVNFEGISVDKLVVSLTHTCKNIFYMVDDFPVENGRLLYMAGDVAGEKAYYLLTTVVREYEGLTQVLMRAESDKNYSVNGFLNEILDNMRHLINANAREIGKISKEQVTIFIDSVVRGIEEERAGRKREEQERLREEEVKMREKEEQKCRLRKKEQDEKEQGGGKVQKEPQMAKITEKAKHEQERITRADVITNEKKERLFMIVFSVVVLMSVFLASGYWVLAPFVNDTNQPLSSSPILSATLTNFNGIEFVLIPAGEFDMGSPANEANRNKNEGPVHHVKIPGAFYMGKYEVTQKQWRKVMGNDPSKFKGDDLPVEQVSWNDAQEFIKKLNENEHVNKYRLPTEAQWEYAARAGTSMMYPFGDNGSNIGDNAWYMGNSQGITHKVGLKNPNPFGLYDMHGNIYEWVQDSFFDSYKVLPKDGSVGESVSSIRVFRGGSWISNAASCRVANRENADQGTRASNLGFRLVRDL